MRKATARTYTWLYRDSDRRRRRHLARRSRSSGACPRRGARPARPGERGLRVPGGGRRGGVLRRPQRASPRAWPRPCPPERRRPSVVITVNDDRFAYYENGHLITGFGLFSYDSREGLALARFGAEVEDLRPHPRASRSTSPSDYVSPGARAGRPCDGRAAPAPGEDLHSGYGSAYLAAPTPASGEHRTRRRPAAPASRSVAQEGVDEDLGVERRQVVGPSPSPTSLTGTPSSRCTEITMPPLADPSSLVSAMPVMLTTSLNTWACRIPF